MDLGLKDKSALVCASSKGLGRAVAEELAAEGARVCMCARTPETLAAAAREIQSRTAGEILPLAADITREADIIRLVEAVRKKWGAIHILVNNAGGPPGGPFEAHNLEAWRMAVELNFLSAVQLCRQVAPIMKEQRWGRIINVTSVAVKQPVEGLMLSNAVRAAVIGFAKTLANELGPYNVLVNNVCPGYTRTARLVQLAENGARSAGKNTQEIYQQWEKQIPLGRLGEPKEFAALVAFLASERASYITGVTVAVDGGFVKSLL